MSIIMLGVFEIYMLYGIRRSSGISGGLEKKRVTNL